jgi:hypothetical protein
MRSIADIDRRLARPLLKQIVPLGRTTKIGSLKTRVAPRLRRRGGPCGYGNAGVQECIYRQESLLKFRSRHGAAKIIALSFVASLVPQKIGGGTCGRMTCRF